MLFGRDAEIRTLNRIVGNARIAQSGVLVVVGEAGIGKSTLLDHVGGEAVDVAVLKARAQSSEQDVAFAGLHQILLPLLDKIDLIPPPQADALAVALALRPGVPGTRFAIGAAALSLLSRAAQERPLLVLVDDAHLLDQPSAAALRFVCRRLIADPIGVVMAARPAPDALILEPGLPCLELSGLNRADVAALLSRRSGEPVLTETVDRIHRATAGNPLAVTELAGRSAELATWAPVTPVEVPARVLDEYTRRITALSGKTRDALLIVAVAEGSSQVIERALAGFDTDSSHLASAEAAGLVRLRPGGVEFVHPLARAGAYAMAPLDTRRRAHRLVAHALPTSEPDRRAWHLSEATIGVDDAVADAMAATARRTVDRGAHAVAATAWERAAMLSTRESVRADRLAAAGEAAWLSGQLSRARELLDRAIVHSEHRAVVDGVRANLELRTGSVVLAARLFRSAAESLASSDPDGAAQLTSDLITACFLLGATTEAMDAATRLESLLATTTSQEVTVRARMTIGIARVLAGAGGIDLIRSAVNDLESGTWWHDDSLRPGWMVMGTLFLRESHAGRRLIDHVVCDMRDRCALGALPGLLQLVARDDAGTDRWAAAKAGYQESVDLARESGQSTDLAMSLAGSAWLSARTGHATSCRADATEAAQLARLHDIHMAAVWAMSAEGDLAMGSGHAGEALAQFEKLQDFLDRIGLHDVDLSPGPERVEAMLRLGRPDQAAAVAETYFERARDKGQPWGLARAVRAQAMVHVGQDAHRLFEQAMELHRSTPDVFEEARTQLTHGAWLRRSRRRSASRMLLRDALATFERLGARPWAEKAATELAATGEHPLRRGDQAVDALTPQELQIALLLASGRTTRESATAMFLSPKTVEYHLRHIYTKLGVRSRTELGVALEQHEGRSRTR